jgi:nitrogen fixation/metabolism regulation signal transduction histidine kinase
VEVRRETPEAWRQDGRTIAGALQAVRGLRAERRSLERVFWLPFLAIYALSLLVALAVASWLARGITGPVQRLFEATRAIGAGRWDVRVPVQGRDELAKLGEHFNDMVGRLDAQSRRLVDLETMAGWREMAQALAHEVQNPLTPIQLTVEAMRTRYHGDDRAYAALIEECSRIVVEEVESLRSLVVRFRDFSRPVEPRFAPIDLNAIVADVGALQRDLRVELDLSAELGPIRADEDRVRQVLLNLARNAQTATSGRESPCLRLATRPAGENVVLVVEDNGPGIPPAERERAFEPYRSGFTGGLGLGLAMVKGIILVHGGSIRVEDGQWGGARFQITLPREPEAPHD